MRCRIGLVALFLSMGATLWAHPHVWVDWGGVLQAKGTHLVDLRLELAWDSDYTSLMSMDYPALASTTLTGDQALAIDKAYGIRAAGNWRDWVTVSWNNHPIVLSALEIQKVAMVGDRAEFYYQVPLDISVGSSGGILRASVTDRTYYTDIGLQAKATGSFEGSKELQARVSFYEDGNNAYYGGMVFPQVLQFQIMAGS